MLKSDFLKHLNHPGVRRGGGRKFLTAKKLAVTLFGYAHWDLTQKKRWLAPKARVNFIRSDE